MFLLVLCAALVSLAALGYAAATARTVRRLRQAVRDATAREEKLLAAAQAVTAASRDSTHSVVETLAASLRVLEPAIDAILVFAAHGEQLRCIFAHGARAAHYTGTLLRLDDVHALPARAARCLHRVESAPDGALIPTDRSALAVPMVCGSSARAIVYAGSRAQRLPSADLVVRAVEHACAAYLLALDREGDRASATYDALTGLFAPRAFRARLAEDLETAAIANSPPIALWFIDTDHFKHVNDSLGHAAGDAVLRSMAALLRSHTVGDLDTAARNGGDEFCAILRGASKVTAIERAQTFCEAVRGHDFGGGIRLSASVGVAVYPFDANGASELLEMADAAMYHSKRSGRDCVSFVSRGGFAVC